MKKTIGIICGVIVVVALFGLCFYAGMKYADKNNKQDTTELKEKDPVEVKDKDELKSVKLNDSLVSDAALIMPNLMCHGYALKLNQKDRTVADLTDNEKLSMVASYFASGLNFDEIDESEEYTGEIHKEVKESEVKRLFEDTSFLKTLTKNKDDNMVGTGYKGFYYDFKDKKYYANVIVTGCIDEEYEDDYLQLTSAKKSSSKLVLNYSYAYLSTIYNEKTGDFTNKLYKEKGDKTPIVKSVEFSEEGFKVDWSKFDSYEFVYDLTDNNLRLEKINFVEAK